MDAQDIILHLRSQVPASLGDLPTTSGIYALWDHTSRMRYIGLAHSEGFRKRIRHKHVTGSEEHSHKFSAAYNVGRLWRNRRSPEKVDAKIAKDLRTAFVMKHCTATTCEITGYNGKPHLAEIEKAVQALATSEELTWCNKFEPMPEPTDLVEALIGELRLDQSKVAALRRQAVRSLEGKR